MADEQYIPLSVLRSYSPHPDKLDLTGLTQDEITHGIKSSKLPDYIRYKQYLTDTNEALAQLAEMIIQFAVNLGLDPDQTMDWARKLQQAVPQSEFDSWIATLLDGGPSIFINTLNELKATYPNGAAGVALVRETDPSKIYVWNGTAWEDFGDYQGIEIKDKSVTTEKIDDGAVTLGKTAFDKSTGNLFDGTVFTDKFVRASTGDLINASPVGQYATTDFIDILNSSHISSNWFSWIAFYNESKTIMSGYTPDALPDKFVLEVPSGARYVRATIDNAKVPFDKYVLSSGRTTSFYQPNKIIRNDILEKKHEVVDFMKDTEYVPIIFKDKPVNLFNKSEVSPGTYINTTNGSLVENSGYSTSAPIEIDNTQTISFNKTAHTIWLNEFGNYIRGEGFIKANNITPPPTAKYIRVSMANNEIDQMMIVYGNVPSTYQPHYTELSSQLIDKLMTIGNGTNTTDNKTEPKDILSNYFEHNPFSFSQKLIGDSITHGMGGTGFATNGEIIPGTTVKANPNGHCWANSYRDLMHNHGVTKEYFSWDSDFVKILSSNQSGNSPSYRRFLNDSTEDLVRFDFKGDKFSVSYQTFTFTGTFEVYVNGNLIREIDTYGEPNENVTTDIDVEWGEHTVLLKATNRSNSSATGNDVVFEGFYVDKKGRVKNYAQSGINSQHVIEQLNTLIEQDDDLIILQIGTNDRNRPLETYKKNMRSIVDYVKAQGKDIILLSPPPTAVSQDNERTHLRTYDIDKAIRQISNEYNVGYITNYDSFFKYSEYTGINIDDMLSDGLHPNDLGYDVIFREFVRQLNIHYPREGVTPSTFH